MLLTSSEILCHLTLKSLHCFILKVLKRNYFLKRLQKFKIKRFLRFVINTCLISRLLKNLTYKS